MRFELKTKTPIILMILLVAGSILLLASLTVGSAQPQLTQAWNRTWGGFDGDVSYGVAVDGGGVYIVGETGVYGTDVNAFLVKYDVNGNQVWNTTWGGTESDGGEGVAVDGGDIYITGNTWSFGAGEDDAFLVKYDVNGNQIWNTTWGGTGRDNGDGVAVSGGYIYLVGYTESFSLGIGDAFLVKYDVNGNQIWNTTWGGTYNDGGEGVAVDGGDIYITGWTFSFGVGDADAFLVKYDVNGNQIWNTTWGGTEQEFGEDVAVGSDVYIVGYTLSFGAGSNDAFLVRYDDGGNQVWNATWGGTGDDRGYGITVGSDVYIVGGDEEDDAFLAQYSTGGNQLWNTTWGGAYGDFSYDVAVGSDVYITGYKDYVNPRTPDAFLVKYALPPVADANGPYTGFEGSPILLDGTGSYDLDGTIVSYDWDTDGDGQYDDGTGSILGYTWGDDYHGPVGLKVTDDDGLTDTNSTTADIFNVAPTVDVGPDLTVNEGDVVTFTGNFLDPGWLDTWDYEWDFGDGTSETGAALTVPLTTTHAYGDNGVYTVKLTVTDDDGGEGFDTLDVTVLNVAPTVDAGPDQTVNEGDIASFSGSFTDPGWLDTHTAVWDFGDGTPPAPGVVTEENNPPDSTGTVTGSHAYGHIGSYTVALTVADDDGASYTDTLVVNVNNVAPIVDAGPDQESLPGHHYTEFCFSGKFMDPSWLDTHTAKWDFGDGSPAETGVVVETNNPPAAVGTVDEASPRCHKYWVPYQDTYTVTLYIYDDAGDVGTDTITVTILTVIGGEEVPLDVGSVLASVLYSYWWVPTLMAMALAVIYVKKHRR